VGVFAQRANAQALQVRLQALGWASRLREEGGRTAVLVPLGEGQARQELWAKLQEAGFSPLWVQAEKGWVKVKGGEGGEVVGEEVQVVPLEPLPVQVGQRHFRGRFLCLAGDGGAVVVNQVDLEDYLLGVVPAEMGFNQLEALKAQAVAARSYALAQRGAHAREGFDLCSGEHCQVYGGVEAENPLASRAVRETAGQVLLYEDQPVRAFFHSTCGGHTEAAEQALTQKPVPYLPGVPCAGESLRLGERGKGSWLGEEEKWALLAQRLALALGASSPAQLAQALAGQAGAPVAQVLGLPDFTPLFSPKPSWEQVLTAFRCPLPSPKAWENPWVQVALLACLSGTIQSQEGVVVPAPFGAGFQGAGTGQVQDLGQALVLWKKGHGYWRGEGETLAGSPARLWCGGGFCPLLEVEPAASADSRSRWQGWVREVPQSALAMALGVGEVHGLQVVARTPTGRVAQGRVFGPFGQKTLSGVELRKLLNLPSTWFVVGQRPSPSGLVLRFYGKGWGHGVGLCQAGAYGLALGGWTYEKILAHYYPGTRLGQVAQGEEAHDR
jgi:peptidoglycan hydrolase-like amidase